MLTFNEWIVYIYKMNNYPQSKILEYEQNCRREVAIQNHQRWAEQDRRNANVRKNKNNPVIERNQ